MDPLKRNNPGVRATNHEDRIQALERRIFPYGLKWAVAGRINSNQTIDTSGENIVFTSFSTNDADIFELDPSNDGILVNDTGYYMTTGFIDSSDLLVARSMYVQAEFLSVYPVFGNEFGRNFYALDTSLLVAAGARQNHHAFGSMLATTSAPYKVVLVAEQLGVNWTATNSALSVWKMAQVAGDD